MAAKKCAICLYLFTTKPEGVCSLSDLIKHGYVNHKDIAEIFGATINFASHKLVYTLVKKGYLDSEKHGKARGVIKKKVKETMDSCEYLEKGIVQLVQPLQQPQAAPAAFPL